jgi:hypothetical protein
MQRGRTRRVLESFARRLVAGRNPLCRSWDRIEAVLLAVVVVAALATVPFAVWVGGTVYDSGQHTVTEQVATRHQVAAVLLQDAPSGTEGENAVATVSVPGRWQLPDGTERVGQVSAKPGTPAGTAVPTWIDGSGLPTAAPMTGEQVTWRAVSTGLATITGALLALAVAFRLVRWRLDRARWSWWEQEWERIEPRWTRRKT